MEDLQRHMEVSQRRACQVVGQPRSTQRYVARRPERDRPLLRRMRQLAGRHPRYGYRRVAAMLREEGWSVNRKRVYRLWRAEGLKVPKRQRKRRHLGCSDNGVVRRRAERPNHVWSYDFLMDQTSDGRRLKILPVVDEFTRENLALEVHRRMGAAGVIEVLKELVGLRGAPEYLRSDNGPEFIAEAIKAWLRGSGVGTLFIEPGAPWENAYIESFNGKLRDELLDREEFGSLLEAKVLASQYRAEYNHRRPHSALGYRTPAAFAAAWVPPGLAALGPAEPMREGSEDLTLITVGT